MCGVFTEFSNTWQDRRLPMYSNTNIFVSVTCAVMVKWPEGINLATLSCKAEMKYLLYTLQINRYCLLVLQSSMFDFDWSDSVMLCSLVCHNDIGCILVVSIVGPIPNIFGFSFFYYHIKYNTLQNFWPSYSLSNLNNFHSLEVGDRVSETQLQVGENSY